MNSDPHKIIDLYFNLQQDLFTADDFYRTMKRQGVKLTKDDILEILFTSDKVFSLVDNKFVTRAGVFTDRVFSFMPTKEELQKGYFVIGHRALPFLNPEFNPDHIQIEVNGKKVESESCVFSMNFATDVFSLYGEGFVFPYIFGDKANTKYSLSTIQYLVPSEIELTAWPIKKIVGNKELHYGDRFLCKFTNWTKGIMEVKLIEGDSLDTISTADMEREEWYVEFENRMLESLQRNGPGSSIEHQLAMLYLENQAALCIKNCGSIEEVFKRTKVLHLTAFGVENRIWKVGSEISFTGKWNEDLTTDLIYPQSGMMFSPQVTDAFVLNYYYELKKNPSKSMEDLIDDIFPFSSFFDSSERKTILRQLKDRAPGLLQRNEFFADGRIPCIRNQVVNLYKQVSHLVCRISNSELRISAFPSQELIIVIQLFSHLFKIIEEMESTVMKDTLPIEELTLSLDGMEDTFYEIEGALNGVLTKNAYKKLTIVN